MRWQGIVVHHTASADTDASDLEAIRRFHINGRGWQDVGYHLLIERIGIHYEPIIARPWYMNGSHAPGKNSTHLGVAFVGDFTDRPPEVLQLECGARAIAGLCVSFGFGPGAVLRHSDVRATECPGKSFPFNQLMEMVAKLT